MSNYFQLINFIQEDAGQVLISPEDYLEKVEEKPFLFLSVDLPSPPLFRDELKESIIPQVPLMQILTKFDGITSQEYKTYKENFIKRYELLRLPRYLIMCFRVLFLFN